ncbi:TolC family protein [Planctomycetes bacterium K23_9]|uniref:Outer membrane efflux protein n=1 Tax=Stieleria marina TaxID=1930275 RepID=A0A517NUT2_9BACT|nr:Outer membrane efflux protein [Planctomycetes bacterium K23_9]
MDVIGKEIPYVNRKWILGLLLILAACVCATGCSRDHYRIRADNDAYSRILEKSQCTPWAVPSDHSVYPAPDSRLYQPTCVNDPRLPSPSPQLYAYELPELPEHKASRFIPRQSSFEGKSNITPTGVGEPSSAPLGRPPKNEGQDKNDPTGEGLELTVAKVSYSKPPGAAADSAPNELQPATQTELLPKPKPDPNKSFEELLRSGLKKDQDSQKGQDSQTSSDSNEMADTAEQDNKDPDEDKEADEETQEVQANQVPLPRSYWETIPIECLSRMFEFKSVRDEYARSFGSPVKESQLDPSPRLALEDIISLTLLNSRELQTQKEALYRVALTLTLQRFAYQLKPSVGNNGSSAGYIHNRSGGEEVNTLGLPTNFQLEKMLYTGGDFIGRFANDVLLTFNGPQGFTADVGSELLFSFSQSLLQRDVQLESLTQAERDVVYAARDFTRFRKELFVQQASDYYSLIRQFRQIEIQCQNYFTLAREFNQRSVEIKYGMAARTQLDQVEQQVINGRQSILSSCTNLENALDSLKIRMGIPTEQPLNIDLSELDLLTLRDELAVNAELIERTRTRIRREINAESRSAFVVLGGVSQLAEQMVDSIHLREKLSDQPLDSTDLENRLLELRIEAADIDIAEDRSVLDQELADEAPDSTKVIQRRRDVSQELLRKVLWQIRRLDQTGKIDQEQDEDDQSIDGQQAGGKQQAGDEKGQSDQQDDSQSEEVTGWINLYEAFGDRLVDLEDSFLNAIFKEQSSAGSDVNEVQDAESRLIQAALTLQEDLQSFADQLDERLGRVAATDDAGFDERAIEFANELMRESERFRDGASGGLAPIEIAMDEAMMTALVQRFDLMNQRGFLADDWRQIKYAADDLKSILNLTASQSIRTRSGENQPFDFNFDDSTTRVGVSLDLPFNRRAQRNQFRASLFNYQRTLRNVMQLEDNIKLAIRRDLRSLKLNGQQYANDIAGAALASERVTGTELEVRSGFATSRDFLESQQAYVQAISGVASDHINYIVGRLQLFLDLESLTVGDNGFWEQLYDEQHQPMPQYQLPSYARPGYGRLHANLKYSKLINRMRCVPDGVSVINAPERDQALGDQGMIEQRQSLDSPLSAERASVQK